MTRRLRMREAPVRPSRDGAAAHRRTTIPMGAPAATRTAQVRTLQHRAGNRATRALLSGDRDGARRRPAAREIVSLIAPSAGRAAHATSHDIAVQRVLSPTTRIHSTEVADVRRLSPDKLVFQLTGVGGETLIVKIETGSQEELEIYGGREREVYRLARAVLEQVPRARPLTAGDFRSIARIPDDLGDAAEFKQIIATTPESTPNAVFLKLETADVGINLGDLVKRGRDERTTKEHKKLKQMLYSKPVMRSLGRMAAFDLLIGNNDRFGDDMDVNVENVDFTGRGAVLPLDNLDPGGRIRPGYWRQADCLESEAAIGEYAGTTVRNMFVKAEKDDTHRQWERSAEAFSTGMHAALAAMRDYVDVLYERGEHDTPRGAIARELARRIEMSLAG